MILTSALIVLFPPTRWISFASIARRSFACASMLRSPISSRNSVPVSASSKRPMRRSAAPVKAPFSWPNISLSTRSRGIAAQFTRTKRPVAPRTVLVDRRCDELLAGAGLAAYQHARISGRYT